MSTSKGIVPNEAMVAFSHISLLVLLPVTIAQHFHDFFYGVHDFDLNHIWHQFQFAYGLSSMHKLRMQ